MKHTRLFSLLFALSMAIAACSDDGVGNTGDRDATFNADADSADAMGVPMDGGMNMDAAMMMGTAAFGEACTNGPDCVSGVCFLFGMLGGSRCTLMCMNDNECPAGSMGQKCSGQGVCRP